MTARQPSAERSLRNILLRATSVPGISVDHVDMSVQHRVWSWLDILVISLTAVAVGIFGVAFRTYALRHYSSLPTGFDGSIMYRVRYLLEHHHFLLTEVPTYSYWSAGVNTQLGFYLMELINACLLATGRATGVPLKLLHQFVLTAALISLTVYMLMRGASGRRKALDVATVSALVTLGTPVVINYLSGYNAAYGWLLLLGLVAVSTSRLNRIWTISLTLFITIISPPIYHTFGFLLTAFVVILWLLSTLTEARIRVVSPGPVIVYYLIYQMYASVQFFGELATGIRDVFTLEFLRRDNIFMAMTVANPSAENQYLRYIHLLIWTLLSIPITLAIIRFITMVRYRSIDRHCDEYGEEMMYVTSVISMTLAILILSILFGLKFNLEFMINRGASYLSIPAVIAAIHQIRFRMRQTLYVYPLIWTVIVLSLFSFWTQSKTVQASNHYTYPETQGYIWLRERLKRDDVVFTDFRLSGAFIADGFFHIVGINGRQEGDPNRLLQRIYRNDSPKIITAALDEFRTRPDNKAPKYLFLSTQMMKDYPGLNGFGTHFDPALPSFFDALARSPDWRMIYSNADARIYMRQAH